MILREIGEDGQMNARASQAVLGKANRTGLNGTVRNASSYKLPKLRL
jgi:hypothetical protein